MDYFSWWHNTIHNLLFSSFKATVATSACHFKDALRTKEAQIVDNDLVTVKPEELQQKQKLAGSITVAKKVLFLFSYGKLTDFYFSEL